MNLKACHLNNEPQTIKKMIIRRILIEVNIILILTFFIALMVNGLRPKGIDIFRGGKPQKEDKSIFTVNIDQALSEFNKKETLFVDARSYEDFSAGHIKSAINLPNKEFDEWITKAINEIDPKTKIVVYCESIHCPEAKELAKKLITTGFENVLYYPGGFEEWIEYKLPVEK
jgi:rhodanese-related sulfurtransferase